MPRMHHQLIIPVFILCLVANFSPGVMAQEEMEVNGMVIDEATRAPLHNVHVININQLKGVVSHQDGYYFIEADPGDTLRFTRIGYEPFQHLVSVEDSILIVEMIWLLV